MMKDEPLWQTNKDTAAKQRMWDNHMGRLHAGIDTHPDCEYMRRYRDSPKPRFAD